MKMYKKYPREIGIPRRITVMSEKEFYEKINKYYKYNNMFTSIYGFKNFHVIEEKGNGFFKHDYTRKKINYESAVVDKIFFDFDPTDNLTLFDVFLQTIKFHKHLLEKKTLHCIHFSGDGFHVFILVKNGDELVLKRDALTNVQDYFVEKLSLTSFDEQIQDNVSRLCRIVNTYNFRVKRWCIPLTEKYLHENMFDEILKLSEKQCYNFEFFGDTLFDILKFDKETSKKKVISKIRTLNLNKTYNCPISEIKVPRCIQELLAKAKNKKHLKWRERFAVILWFKENNCKYEDLLKLIQKSFKGENEHGISDSFHCLKEEQQPYFIYRADKYTALTCERMRKMAYCDPTCTLREELYYRDCGRVIPK